MGCFRLSATLLVFCTGETVLDFWYFFLGYSFLVNSPVCIDTNFCVYTVCAYILAQLLVVDWREGAVGRIGERLVSHTNEDSKISFLSTNESTCRHRACVFVPAMLLIKTLCYYLNLCYHLNLTYYYRVNVQASGFHGHGQQKAPQGARGYYGCLQVLSYWFY